MPSVSVPSDQRSAVSVQPCGETSCCSGDVVSPAVASQPAAAPGQALTGKAYWRSLDELADTPEFRDFMYREFPAGATEMLNDASGGGTDRREFIKIMGASLALAGVGMSGGGCRRWPEEKIAPYAHRPAGHNDGTTNHYATCMELGGVATGLLVTSYDFRPIKIEGNPSHPVSQGATDALAQASILDLYDPDRSQSVMLQGKKSDWATFAAWMKELFGTLKKDPSGTSGGASLAVLSEATNSPSVMSMKKRLLAAFPKSRWHEYEPLNNDHVIGGTVAAFGSPMRAYNAFDKARVIVSLDSDFLHCDPSSIQHSREFAKGRRAEDRRTMNRLYVFESGVSVTGANADHRVAMRSADVALIAARIAAAVVPNAAGTIGDLATTPIGVTATDPHRLDLVIQRAIDDLKNHQGAGVVIAGPRQPAEVHYLVHLINAALGNHGKTINFTPVAGDAMTHLESIKALAQSIDAGQVTTLVILGGNPVYNAPVDLKFADLLKKVNSSTGGRSVHLSDYYDETSQQCHWHVNRAHYLETWGDGRAADGTISIAQPLIDANDLFGGRSSIELLAAMIGDEAGNGYDLVRRTYKELNLGGDFEGSWRKSLHDGIVPGTASAAVIKEIAGQSLGQHIQSLKQKWSAPKGDEMELIFAQDNCLYDGRFGNNGWLQELPDPLTKLTWDNAVIIGTEAAKQRGLKSGDMVIVKAGGREMKAAVIVQPGQHTGSATLALGYGRGMKGRICEGAGFDFYQLRRSDAMGYTTSGSIAKADGTYPLAITQLHFTIDSVGGHGIQERLPTLFREGNLEEYEKDPAFARHRVHVVHRLSLWEEALPHQGAGQNANYAWAMSIDLNSCTGCSACVIACQAENNIPIVGKDQVIRGREMHWIRIDRYYKGGTENMPDGYMQSPVMCMHCENAPCEQVCPVAATTHDADGLNVMVYNRCVGTRYCSNNCPYKVRRFNYFDYHARGPLREQPGMLLQVEPDYYTKGQAIADPLRQMQFNPDVTVRMRGIMEKCTYCVQRITSARVNAKNEWVKKDHKANPTERITIPDGSFTTACAQACPTQAIVFGDLHDPNSRVAKLHKYERAYEMLEELNTKPRTKYMAKLRNPAPGLAAATPAGHGHETAGEAKHG